MIFAKTSFCCRVTHHCFVFVCFFCIFEGFPRRYWNARAKRSTWTKGTSSIQTYIQPCIHHPSHKSTESLPVAAFQGLQGARGPPGPAGPQGTQVSQFTANLPFPPQFLSCWVTVLRKEGNFKKKKKMPYCDSKPRKG